MDDSEICAILRRLDSDGDQIVKYEEWTRAMNPSNTAIMPTFDPIV
jgi:hypothetical protein